MSLSLRAQYIVLADDDKDDVSLFKDVLDELPVSTHLETVYNGEQLMRMLNEKKRRLPDVLFLDLNMPRKNGFECLSEIKNSEKLKNLRVVIFSTSMEPEMMDLLYKSGAHYCIRKPNKFSQLIEVIHLALVLTSQVNLSQPPKEKFMLSSETFQDEKK